jgi:hypothetical protein
MVTDELREAGVQDLLDEVTAKNHVVVRVFRSIRPVRSAYAIQKQVLEELGETVANLPALVRQDHWRMLAGLKPIYADECLRRLGGELVSVTPNLRTNVGIDWVADQLSSTTAVTTSADYVGLSNNTITPAAGDASSTVPWSSAQAADAAASGTTGEYTAVGLARKQATYAHTGSATSYTMTATWTATGTITSVRLAGMFGGSARTTQGNSANNKLFLENTFTATTLANTDQLSLTWTVNI